MVADGKNTINKQRRFRWLWLILGHFFLALGAVGIVIPLLPTTPLWLLAVLFYSRSSQKFHDWVMNHPKYGDAVRAFYERGIVTRKPKIFATVVMTGSGCLPTFVLQTPVYAVVTMWVCLFGVMVFLWTRPEG